MTYKTVSQLNDDGYFIGVAIAQESPLEPGVFLIPRNAIDLEPPTFDPTTQVAKFEDGVWSIENIVIESSPPPTPSPEEVRLELTRAVQGFMNETAAGLGYDSIYSAVTYAEEPAVPKYQAEGRALRAWRSLVWAKCYEVLAAVEAGTRAVPSAAELIAELPVFTAP